MPTSIEEHQQGGAGFRRPRLPRRHARAVLALALTAVAAAGGAFLYDQPPSPSSDPQPVEDASAERSQPKVEPTPEPFYLRGPQIGLRYTVTEPEKLPKEIRRLERKVATAQGPETLRFVSRLADYLDAVGRGEDAEKVLRETYDPTRELRAPGDFLFQSTFAWLLVDRRHFEEAQDAFDRIIQAGERSPKDIFLAARAGRALSSAFLDEESPTALQQAEDVVSEVLVEADERRAHTHLVLQWLVELLEAREAASAGEWRERLRPMVLRSVGPLSREEGGEDD